MATARRRVRPDRVRDSAQTPRAVSRSRTRGHSGSHAALSSSQPCHGSRVLGVSVAPPTRTQASRVEVLRSVSPEAVAVSVAIYEGGAPAAVPHNRKVPGGQGASGIGVSVITSVFSRHPFEPTPATQPLVVAVRVRGPESSPVTV